MDAQAMKTMRRLYQADPRFRRALEHDPETALVNWGLAGSETAKALATSLRELLKLSPEGILASILAEDLPDWHGPTPGVVPSG